MLSPAVAQELQDRGLAGAGFLEKLESPFFGDEGSNSFGSSGFSVGRPCHELAG